MLRDVVLDPDSEYHIGFVLKLFFVGHNLEIPGHFYDFSALFLVFSLFEYFLHFFSSFRSHIRIEHEKLHRSTYITHCLKNSLGKNLAYTS